MANALYPGIYIEEIPTLPPSIASVETAMPAFIGYTEKARKGNDDLTGIPLRISSLIEYEQYFGYASPEARSLSVIFTNAAACTGSVDESKRSSYLLYYGLRMFFSNGGGPCRIISVGSYRPDNKVLAVDLNYGLQAAAGTDEITLLVFPDAVNLGTATEYYALHNSALQQCADQQDRFTIMDVYHTQANGNVWTKDIIDLRSLLPSDTRLLKYGAAYFPRIISSLSFHYRSFGSTGGDDEASILITGMPGYTTLEALRTGGKQAEYLLARNALQNIRMLLPVSLAAAGVYANTDQTRGVWKAPANEQIILATGPQYTLTQQDQDPLNVDVNAGKSINVIRTFPGRGTSIIWGARTLAGNDNEWRYIPVRRFFNMVEESVKKGTARFVFEPNTISTWTTVKSMINNYLTQLWKAGALMGATTKEAFFVKAGLNETMTTLDIDEGRMIIEIGLAVTRPAEFIIIRFKHKMLSADHPFHAMVNEVIHSIDILKGPGRKLKTPFRFMALFTGPPDPVKFTAARQLAERLGKELVRIDLSQLVSKYIGETEKNLNKLFDLAEEKEWVLFFDEAGALFGKRTDVKDAHDRYANQDISYLLQRMENYHGLVILASNMKNNIDEAFLRRFRSVVHFTLQTGKEKKK